MEGVLPAIAGDGTPLDEATAAQPGHETAEISRVEPELTPHVGGRRTVLVGQLVEHPDLRETEPAAEQVLVEDADTPGVEPVEPADGVDLGGIGHI
jgi:hypothetical protein